MLHIQCLPKSNPAVGHGCWQGKKQNQRVKSQTLKSRKSWTCPHPVSATNIALARFLVVKHHIRAGLVNMSKPWARLQGFESPQDFKRIILTNSATWSNAGCSFNVLVWLEVVKLVLTNSKNSQSVSNVGDCIEGTSEAAIGAESSFALWATNLLSLFTFLLNQLLSTAPVAVLACIVLVNCEMTMLGSHWHHKAPKVEKKLNETEH